MTEIDKLSPANEPRPPHRRVATDLGRSTIRNAEIAGKVLGVSAASTVSAVVGLGRSTVRGMSSVMQRDDDDDNERTEDDAGTFQDQVDLLTQRLTKVKDAGDKHDFEFFDADVDVTRQSCRVTGSVSPNALTKTRARHIIEVGW